MNDKLKFICYTYFYKFAIPGGNMDKDLFSKISTEKLRENIYKQLIDYGPEIQIQLVPQSLDYFKAKSIENSEVVMERQNTPPSALESQKILASVVIGPDRYFIKTSLRADDRFYYLKKSDEIYKIQRRENFRLSMPDDWKAIFKIYQIADKTFVHEYSVFDISISGFSFDYQEQDKPPYKIEQNLSGQLVLPNRLDISISANIKNHRKAGNSIRIGVAFEALNSKDESKIQRILMELHRAFFSRLD